MIQTEYHPKIPSYPALRVEVPSISVVMHDTLQFQVSHEFREASYFKMSYVFSSWMTAFQANIPLLK